MNLDEKTGKIVSSSSSCDDCDNNIDGKDKNSKINKTQKLIKLSTSNSMPDLPAPTDQGTKSSSTTTLSSNINNQSSSNSSGSNSNGKQVVLALEDFNQINECENHNGGESEDQLLKKNIILNIDPSASSSSASSVNLDMAVVTEITNL